VLFFLTSDLIAFPLSPKSALPCFPREFLPLFIVSWCETRYNYLTAKRFRRKRLRRLFETGNASGIQASHAKRLRLQLSALDTAWLIEDMNIPEFRLHPLKGATTKRWSITVSGNWRVTFEFEDGNAFVMDYENYH